MEDDNMCSVDVREMELKCTSKSEVYKVLTLTGNVYLPPMQQINSDFIRDIMWGEKCVTSISDSWVYCWR